MYRVLTGLGYFLGLEKFISSPATRLQYLGMLIDTNEQDFIVPQDKRQRFAELREFILGCKTSVSLKSIQKMMGKCNSFSLAFPGAKFYVREMAAAIGKAGHGREVSFTQGLRKELEFGGFLDTWDKCVPWRQERRVSLVMSTDASSYRWAVIFHFPPRKQKVEITGKRTSAKNKLMSKNLAQFCKPLGAYQHQYETVESMLESITR